jgi:hypothetical protein
MRRRDFIWLFGGSAVTCIVGCKSEEQTPIADAATGSEDSSTLDDPPDDAMTADACMQKFVKMHDTNAQALYLDGTKGPLTGVITVAHVIASAKITLDFWHGHDGQLHRFTLEPMHFAQLKKGERVTVGTTVVDGHSHTLFVDPKDESYRVAGAPDVDVPLGC